MPLSLLLIPLALAFQAAPAARPVRFMGIEAEATRVAFVCDGSRWTQTKDDELAAELIRAVEPLGPDQQFAVLFFADGRAWGPDDGKPLAATEENKRKLRGWLQDLETGRDSTPAPGLARAFEARPDAVFFVSDGQFGDYDDVARLVAKLNPERTTRVHTVGYFLNEAEDDSRAFVDFLRKLADDHGGQFKVAYAEEMRRRAP
jgi:hypothetical protein